MYYTITAKADNTDITFTKSIVIAVAAYETGIFKVSTVGASFVNVWK